MGRLLGNSLACLLISLLPCGLCMDPGFLGTVLQWALSFRDLGERQIVIWGHIYGPTFTRQKLYVWVCQFHWASGRSFVFLSQCTGC